MSRPPTPTTPPGQDRAPRHDRVVSRFLADDLRAGAVIVLVTLVAAMLLAAWPRAVQVVSDDIVTHRLEATSPIVRDIASSNQAALYGPADGSAPAGPGLPEEWQTTFGALDGGLRAIHDAMPEPLQAGVRDGRLRTYSTDFLSGREFPGSDVTSTRLRLSQDPYLSERVTLTEGRWPTGTSAAQGPEEVFTVPTEVVMSEAAAERLAWAVSETRETFGQGDLLLVGTYVADDPDDGYWYHSPSASGPYIVEDPNVGVVLTAALYRGPGEDLRIQQMRVWFEVQPPPWSHGEVSTVADQLRGFTALQQDVGPPPDGWPVTFTSELPPVIDTTLRDVSATTTVVALLASGPVAGLGLLLLVATRVVATRRRTALALVRARGGSGLQVRGLMAVEGLVLGVLGGGLGLLGAVLLVPTAFHPATLVGPLLAALAPAVVLAASVPPAGLRAERADAGARSASRLRRVWELLALAVAATAAVLVLRRGAEDTGAGTDPLLAATPALVAVAAAVVVARIAPLLLAPVVRAARAGRGALGFVGVASATRDRRGQLPPLVGLVVAVTVAVLSVVLLTTVRGGLETEAWERTGADLRSTGPIVDAETLDRVRSVPGVDAATTLTDRTPAALTTGDGRFQARVLLVDPADLAEVQADVPGWEVPDLTPPAGPDGLVPALVSSGFDLGPDATVTVDSRRIGLDVLDQVETVPGGSSTSSWVLVDRETVSALTGVEYLPRILLVRLDEGLSASDEAEVVAQVGRLTGPSAVELRSDAVERRLEDPTLAGLQAALLVATLVSLLVGAATMVLGELMATGRRERLFAVLKLLGMPPRGPRVITTWEIASWAAPAIVTGLVVGGLLPLVVSRSVDLSAFTGGASAPPLVYDPLALLGVTAVFVVVVGVCGLVSAALGRRVSSAATLRSVQE